MNKDIIQLDESIREVRRIIQSLTYKGYNEEGGKIQELTRYLKNLEEQRWKMAGLMMFQQEKEREIIRDLREGKFNGSERTKVTDDEKDFNFGDWLEA